MEPGKNLIEPFEPAKSENNPKLVLNRPNLTIDFVLINLKSPKRIHNKRIGMSIFLNGNLAKK